ncbi:MAG: type III-A CRISPR-associated RAMP protein Csm5 [Treponema sp.]|jgi:CRISPR-associated protein Csm5|nr:type III-A CRISPR-associated RAMP protein Csm5 [Treponema sp.]
MAKEQYALTLTPLTGVHIGTGGELTPLDYKIASKVGDIDFKRPVYWKFSGDRILQRLGSDEKKLAAFENASVNGNMKELQAFFQNHCTEKSDTDYPCDITGEFLKTYNANKDKDPCQNAATVLQMYHAEGTPRPVIPGTSIKGSIRTALLNHYLAGLSDNEYGRLQHDFENMRNPEKAEETLQKAILGYSDERNDPFRAVLVSDCSFKASGTQLVGGLKIVKFNGHTESLEALGAPIQAEVLKGEFLGGKASSELLITIDADLQALPSLIGKYPPKRIKAISFQDLRNACNDFYWSLFQEEFKKNHYGDVYDGTEETIVKLKKRLEEAAGSNNQFIIRLGRWSQVEFVTFEETFRNPRTKKDGRGKPLPWGTTRTLFDYDGRLVPMGWCVLSLKGQG